MLVIFHADADGRCAAAVVYKAFLKPDDMRFIEMDYNKEFPLADVRQNEEVYIVDFSLKPEVMKVLLRITPLVYWCDQFTPTVNSANVVGLNVWSSVFT